jgi:RNA polymerase sigma-70 factor (ECF subfamily)
VNFSDLDDLHPLATSSSDSPEQMVLRAEKQMRLEAGLDSLTERERAALLLRDVEDLPAEEVAKHLNCSKATVRSHIANARVKFKRFLERRKA